MSAGLRLAAWERVRGYVQIGLNLLSFPSLVIIEVSEARYFVYFVHETVKKKCGFDIPTADRCERYKSL